MVRLFLFLSFSFFLFCFLVVVQLQSVSGLCPILNDSGLCLHTDDCMLVYKSVPIHTNHRNSCDVISTVKYPFASDVYNIYIHIHI